MRRRLGTFAVMSALALALNASPALAGSPAVHDWVPASQLGPVPCGANNERVYVAASGGLSTVMHYGVSASGNVSAIMTMTARDLVATLNGKGAYPVVGVERFTGTRDSTTYVWVFKLRVVGTADSLNVVVHSSPNGDYKYFNFGTCGLGGV